MSWRWQWWARSGDLLVILTWYSSRERSAGSMITVKCKRPRPLQSPTCSSYDHHPDSNALLNSDVDWSELG